ncbi:adenylate and guanylate cyclase catalytic domain-containing protein [Entophlyctis helioformis]|nr:adenylate and guanylate cyclase catalytic domain-containing protein [Entophlyctis helioformis]
MSDLKSSDGSLQRIRATGVEFNVAESANSGDEADRRTSEVSKKVGDACPTTGATGAPGSAYTAASDAASASQTAGGCPVFTNNDSGNSLLKEISNGAFSPEAIAAKKAAAENAVPDPGRTVAVASAGKDSENEKFRAEFTRRSEELYKALRAECDAIENNFEEAEYEVLRKDDITFLMVRQQAEVSRLQASQLLEVKHRSGAFERSMAARKDRKDSKRHQRATIRQTKRRDLMIQRQETASRLELTTRSTLTERREAFDALIDHMESVHDRQRRQLAAAQERKITSEKALTELENRHLPEEMRLTSIKKFLVRQTHRMALNKRINEQLHELQQVELRHAKERFDLEVESFEEMSNLDIANMIRLAEFTDQQLTELQTEKERLLAKHEADKLILLTQRHTQHMKRLQHEQRVVVRQLKLQHEQKITARKEQKLRGQEGAGPVHISSNTGSKKLSRQGSNGSLEEAKSDSGSRVSSGSNRNNLALNSAVAFGRGGTASQGTGSNINEGDEVASLSSESQRNHLDSIAVLRAKQLEERSNLKTLIHQETAECQRAKDAKMAELEEDQQLELAKLRTEHREEIKRMIVVQEKEIQMEQSVYDAEMLMLVERRILNSVLNTVVDGIINITPNGAITRFNAAAERMFGYKADEIIGKSINSLMPERYAVNHDQYILNYLTTGIKKAIGRNRRIYGLKKDGTEFPIQLSLSEVKENDQHFFTGIARDMTEEVRLEKENHDKEMAQKAELAKLVTQLEVSRNKADDLLSQMLPPSVSRQLLEGKQVEPQSYESATIFFLDVVGFTTICSSISPMETVGLLNGIYQIFDDIIEQYDAYKVETIGDSYMVVSGLPKRNGERHASEIANLALHILAKVYAYKFEHNPELKLRVRIGINTGPVVAGVVGSKMPRYCLFGDTVNTASRMESTGTPMKIQVSESTYKMLSKAGGYRLLPRGETEVKGKGKMTTFFLTGKTDFPFELPPN